MKKYEPPVCETIMLGVQDVIVTSNPGKLRDMLLEPTGGSDEEEG